MMTKPKFLFIDDEVSSLAIAGGLNDTGIVDVDAIYPKQWDISVSGLQSEVRRSYSGLILDLRLDQALVPIEKDVYKRVSFTAPSLAQEIRSKSNEAKWLDIPIALCSTDEKIKKLYSREQTSQDLFDLVFLKEAQPNWIKIATRLKCIAFGYEAIKEHKNSVETLIGRELNEVDSRALGKFFGKKLDCAAHEFSQYWLQELIRWPGPLVGPDYLAAKLGLDRNRSMDWNTLLQRAFGMARYKGIFSDGWDRWWTDLIALRFRELTGFRYSELDANGRCRELIKATKLKNLVPADPIENSTSTHFSTICEYFKTPLDALEGFRMLEQRKLAPWQDQKYLSFQAAAERKGLERGLGVHPSEMERLQDIKRRKRAT